LQHERLSFKERTEFRLNTVQYYRFYQNNFNI